MFLTEYYVRSTLINYQQHYRHHLCIYIYILKKINEVQCINLHGDYFIELRIQRPTFLWWCSERAERFRLLCNMQPSLQVAKILLHIHYTVVAFTVLGLLIPSLAFPIMPSKYPIRWLSYIIPCRVICAIKILLLRFCRLIYLSKDFVAKPKSNSTATAHFVWFFSVPSFSLCPFFLFLI